MSGYNLTELDLELKRFLKQEQKESANQIPETDFEKIEARIRRDMFLHKGYYNLRNFTDTPSQI